MEDREAEGAPQYVEMVLQHEQQQLGGSSHHQQAKEATTATDRDCGSGDQYGGPASHMSMSMGSNGVMLAGNSSSSAPRLHPKKRPYVNEAEGQFSTGGQEGNYSQQQQSTFQSPQQTNEASLGYPSPGGDVIVASSSAGSGGGGVVITTTTSAMERQPLELVQSQSRRVQQPELDLRDWCETRVLAKYKKGESVFVQGVIKSSDVATELLVEFEGPDGGLRQTYDVINSNRFDIIADASPSVSDVSTHGIAIKVCF